MQTFVYWVFFKESVSMPTWYQHHLRASVFSGDSHIVLGLLSKLMSDR